MKLYTIFTLLSATQAANYIVQTKPGDRYLERYASHFKRLSDEKQPVSHFKIGRFSGFLGDFSDSFMEQLRLDDAVLEISGERLLTLDQVEKTQEFAPAHLSELSGASNRTFKYDANAGIGVDVIVIDSGINQAHPDFTGRVKRLATYVAEQEDDLVGHGTAVAGVIGSETFGVAKKCNIVDIKVADQTQKARLSAVIQALDFAVTQSKETQRPTVIVLAMTTSSNKLLDNAVKAAVDEGLAVIVSAGNGAGLACSRSPSAAEEALSVGAVNTATNSVASFSNWGACVDVFASGVDVITTSNFGNDIHLVSGTSVAAGQVAGLTAVYMGSGLTNREAMRKVLERAARGVTVAGRENTVDLLARI